MAVEYGLIFAKIKRIFIILIISCRSSTLKRCIFFSLSELLLIKTLTQPWLHREEVTATIGRRSQRMNRTVYYLEHCPGWRRKAWCSVQRRERRMSGPRLRSLTHHLPSRRELDGRGMLILCQCPARLLLITLQGQSFEIKLLYNLHITRNPMESYFPS